MKQIFLSCLLSGLLVSLFAQNNQYLFILDASGSMWQKIGEEHKITIARAVMKKVLPCLLD